MTPSQLRGALAALLAIALGTARSAPLAAQNTAAPSVPTAARFRALARAHTDSVLHRYIPADVHFMAGMIGHHAQAITISRWAATHGASPEVRTLADRIINSQRDEITLMQEWLRERHLAVPVADTTWTPGRGAMPAMAGMSNHALMPGMLTEPQMVQLDQARGPAFDRLFLTDMIQHHSGALEMVRQLTDTYGAMQDDMLFKFVANVNVDQTTEIARMRGMLVMQMLEHGSQ